MNKKQEREYTHSKYGGRCAYCGIDIQIKDMQIDHIKPIFRNDKGKVDLSNLEKLNNKNPSCRSCNNRKHTLSLEDFRKAVENSYNVLMRDSNTFKLALRYGIVERQKENILFYFEKVNHNERS